MNRNVMVVFVSLLLSACTPNSSQDSAEKSKIAVTEPVQPEAENKTEEKPLPVKLGTPRFMVGAPQYPGSTYVLVMKQDITRLGYNPHAAAFETDASVETVLAFYRKTFKEKNTGLVDYKIGKGVTQMSNLTPEIVEKQKVVDALDIWVFAEGGKTRILMSAIFRD